MEAAPETGSPQNVRTRLWAAVALYIVVTLVASAGMLAVQSLSGIDASVLSLVQFAPAIGALITWVSFRENITRLLPAEIPWRRVRVDLLAIIVACVSIWLLAAAAMAWSGHAVVGPVAVAGTPFAVFVVLQFIGACGEEIGWRGMLQPLLESRMGRLAAVALTGAIWALWHVQAFASGFVAAISFIVAAMSFSVLLGYLGNGGVRQRVLIASIGHWLINIAWYLVAGDNTLDRPQVVFVAVGAAVVAATVMAVRAVRHRAH
ncbi:MAG: family intrarane metalloprotease [Nocardia sp.]|uniref:CPBP family intramembrane glutamic endopeptidase n=1 Tax=Nocardia sp. TaxID=1821 RepID=UPI00261371C1|nr:type II CAAX endopeptidase family protein [Nocardia sp.]MCU1648405.1 family intrarane metalloprotease [Nocardia sp.]